MARVLVLFLFAFLYVTPQQAQTERQASGGAAQSDANFIPPSDLNVIIEPDARTLVVMAAINLAGFDYETGGQPLSPLRAEVRRNLAGLDPALREKLAAFYKAHKRPGVDEASDAARYAALSLMMTPPPAFSVYVTDETAIPDDLQPLLGFVPLVQEFYIKSGIKAHLPKYLAVGNAYAQAYRRPVGEAIYESLAYSHARPETVIRLRPLVVTGDEPGASKKKPKQSIVARTRTRHVFVVPDPLAPLGASFVRGDILNKKDDITYRRIGDDYNVVIGPSKTPNLDAVRQALIRFVIDPVIERHLKASLEYKDPILKLASSIPTAGKQFSSSVYLVLRESLAQAVEARLRRIEAGPSGGAYSEDDAVYDLAQAYLRGSALVFHFYDSLIGLEKVGISIEDFFDQMLATTKFEREATRAKEFEPVVARVSAARKASASREARSGAEPADAALGAVTKKILQSDDLIRQRRFKEASVILDEIIAVQPNNARALYGLAQVVNHSPSAVELDMKADENDKIQAQHDRLGQAVKLYRKAIENASQASEAWLIQWSHVLIGRILDFQEFRADAVAEYEKAIALGDVPNGAYKEALEGKRQPFGQK